MEKNKMTYDWSIIIAPKEFLRLLRGYNIYFKWEPGDLNSCILTMQKRGDFFFKVFPISSIWKLDGYSKK